MKLIWKLLRQHIHVGQLAGFFFANYLGMVIVLLGIQFYTDVKPIFGEGDSFLKKDYIIVSKKVSTLGSFVGKSRSFSQAETDDIKAQPFTKEVGSFTSSQFKVSAGIGMESVGLNMSTALFFESVPDAYVDVKLDKWKYTEGNSVIPIIIPRNYLNLYNFGFAQSRNLPQLSDNVMGLVSLDVRITGNGKSDRFEGRIVGFSNRLNTILVPEEFMEWANRTYAPQSDTKASRLIIEVDNPADDRIARYFREKGYETEDNKLDSGKTLWFLKVIVGIVLSVGLLISLLSFYILILSIFLLVQKNTAKFENLLLLGYSPMRVSFPYQALTLMLNAGVWVLSTALTLWIRSLYMEQIESLSPSAGGQSLWPTYIAGGCIFVLVSAFNVWMVRRKVTDILK